jgi:hypothetical protein
MIYFLGGLPRSGNTLLSSILNQNPGIYSSQSSPMLPSIMELHHKRYREGLSISGDFELNFTNSITSFVNGFYSHIDKPVIIDRNKEWGRIDSVELAKLYISKNPKIIFSVRNILDVLSSFINILGNNSSYVDQMANDFGFKKYGRLTQNDVRCDFLMSPNGHVFRCMNALSQALDSGYNIHLVDYDKLIETPLETMNSIHNFLEIENYDYAFNNIKKIEVDKDYLTGLPEDMHKVRSKLEKISIPYKNTLSDYVIEKYSNLEFWK